LPCYAVRAANLQIRMDLSLTCNRRHRLSLALRRFRPHHVIRRARLLWYVSERLAIRLPCVALLLRERHVRQLRPVTLHQQRITPGAKRGPRLDLSFCFDLFPCAPLNDGHPHRTSSTSVQRRRHYSSASGSLGRGPMARSRVTCSSPFTRRAASTGQGSRTLWMDAAS